MSGTDTRERALVDAVSLDNLKRDNAEIAKGVRLSGSAEEAAAFAYIASRCRSFAYRPNSSMIWSNRARERTSCAIACSVSARLVSVVGVT